MKIKVLLLAIAVFFGVVTALWWWLALAPNRMIESVFSVEAPSWKIPTSITSEYDDFSSDGISVWKMEYLEGISESGDNCPAKFTRDRVSSEGLISEILRRAIKADRPVCIAEKQDGNTVYTAYLQGTEMVFVVVNL